jgi:hypothetical protein
MSILLDASTRVIVQNGIEPGANEWEAAQKIVDLTRSTEVDGPLRRGAPRGATSPQGGEV